MGFRQTHADGGLGSISGVVSTLPAGYTLGEERWEGNVKYRLIYNAGNSQVNPGQVMSAVPIQLVTASASPYSMTITTTSGAGNHVAAAVVHHATLTTGTYGWGVVKGRLTSGVVCNAAVSASTGGLFAIDSAGGVFGITTMSLANPPIGITFASLTTGSTTPSRTGDVLIAIEP